MNDNKDWDHPAAALAFAGWASTFILIWLLLLGRVGVSVLSVLALLFFAIVGFLGISIHTYLKHG